MDHISTPCVYLKQEKVIHYYGSNEHKTKFILKLFDGKSQRAIKQNSVKYITKERKHTLVKPVRFLVLDTNELQHNQSDLDLHAQASNIEPTLPNQNRTPLNRN